MTSSEVIYLILEIVGVAGACISAYAGAKVAIARLEEKHAALSEKVGRLEINDGEHFNTEKDHEHRITVLEGAIVRRG